MSTDQSRVARGPFRWSQGELAASTDAPLWFVIAFKVGDSPTIMADHEVELREALETAEIKFDGDLVTLASRGRGRVN